MIFLSFGKGVEEDPPHNVGLVGLVGMVSLVGLMGPVSLVGLRVRFACVCGSAIKGSL